jgi:hypothetical protein
MDKNTDTVGPKGRKEKKIEQENDWLGDTRDGPMSRKWCHQKFGVRINEIMR